MKNRRMKNRRMKVKKKGESRTMRMKAETKTGAGSKAEELLPRR
jgi:hypothetical protein